MQLKGKRVLITGAGSGIGQALAIEAARRGMTVGLCGRRVGALRETVAMMEPGKHLLLPGDLTRSAFRSELSAYLGDHWGGLDVLINNAGVVRAGPLQAGSDDDLSRVIETNVMAPVALTRDLLPLLRNSAPSRIVNIGSIFGDIAYPLFSFYSASKFALRGFSSALRRELEQFGIGVTYAAPRGTRTAAVHAFEQLVEPLQIRLDEPERVAANIWRAVERDADTAYARGPERFFVLIERLFPQLVDFSIRQRMKDVNVQAYLNRFLRSGNNRAVETGQQDHDAPLPPPTVRTSEGDSHGAYFQAQNLSKE